MTESDVTDFMTLLADVYAFYRRDFSKFAGRFPVIVDKNIF